MTNPTADSLYETIKSLRLTRAQARRLLPEWWSPGIETSPDGVAELAMHLGRRLSLDVAELLAGRIVPRGAVQHVVFKHQAQVEAASLEAASCIASSLAQAIIAALPLPYSPLAGSTAAIQARARKLGDGVLTFSSLTSLCWRHGIPVIPLPNLPVGVRKMDGAALQVGNRPAIILAKRKSSRAWLSFILAHEAAHIALGHLTPGSSIVDVSLQDMATYATESSQDSQEAEADRFALEILGDPAAKQIVATWSTRWSPVELAVAAREAAQVQGLEPGHLILRYAFLSCRWPEAIIALRFLQEDTDADVELIRQLKEHVDMELIAEDLQDMVQQITGWNEAS